MWITLLGFKSVSVLKLLVATQSEQPAIYDGAGPDYRQSHQLFNEHRDLFLWKWVFPWKLWKPYPGLFKWGNMGKVSTTTWALFSQFKVRREYFALQSHSSGRQYSGGGVAWRERGQEIRIRVINNFCLVINHRHSIPLLPRHTPNFMSSSLFAFHCCFLSSQMFTLIRN